MKSKEYTLEMIDKFGAKKAIDQFSEAISIWEYKKTFPEINDINICNQTINYFIRCKEFCKEQLK